MKISKIMISATVAAFAAAPAFSQVSTVADCVAAVSAQYAEAGQARVTVNMSEDDALECVAQLRLEGINAQYGVIQAGGIVPFGAGGGTGLAAGPAAGLAAGAVAVAAVAAGSSSSTTTTTVSASAAD